MRSILLPANKKMLEKWAHKKLLVAFDYDGTLAPLVANPLEAQMSTTTQELLAELCGLYPVVVISGRARSDIFSRLGALGVAQVIGNHGIEPWHSAAQYKAEVSAWLPSLHAVMGEFPGTLLENKQYSVAVHYRNATDKTRARDAILRAVNKLPRIRVITGKQVINVVPIDSPNKGNALLFEQERLACEASLYVGDDDTDEDVFVLEKSSSILGIRVGAKTRSAAKYYVKNQLSVDSLLRSLIKCRN